MNTMGLDVSSTPCRLRVQIGVYKTRNPYDERFESFRKVEVRIFGVLVMRILLCRVLYYRVLHVRG